MDFEKESICLDCKHFRHEGDEMYSVDWCENDAGERNFGSLFGCCDFVRCENGEIR